MSKVAAVMMALGIALAGAAGEARGAEFPGSGTLAGQAKLKVRGCGKTRDGTEVAVVVAADGAWVISDGTATFGGTGAILGKAGRKLALTLDEPSMASVIAMLEEDAGILCDTTVTATGVTTRKAQIKVSSKGTRARLKIVLAATGTTADDVSGKAKYRVTASGAWIGPLSCEDVFACTRACPIDDAPCAQACVAQADLATQAAVTTLNECVDAACPFSDPVCIGGALSGVCKTAYEACVPPPPPTNLTCEEIFDCTDDCGRQQCVDDCFDRGSERGRDEAIAVSNCVSAVCAAGVSGCRAKAFIGVCAYVWEECTGTPPPQNLGCGTILACFDTCVFGGSACQADCRNRGSTLGQARLAVLEACVDAACPTRAPACVANTVTGQCQAEWATCLG